MNKLNVLKAVKVVSGIAAVASAVAGTVMVVKAVRQYQEDVNDPKTHVLIAYSSDEDTKKVTEKLQKDARKVIAASVGTVVVSGVFALIASKASKMIANEETRFLIHCFACSDANGHYCYDLLTENGIEYDIDKMVATTRTSDYMNKEVSDIRYLVSSLGKTCKFDTSNIIAQLDKYVENNFER